jgi:hypothetical protein
MINLPEFCCLTQGVQFTCPIEAQPSHTGKTGSETSEIQKRRGFNGLVDICGSVEIQRNWLKLAGDPTYGVFDLIKPLRPLSEFRECRKILEPLTAVLAPSAFRAKCGCRRMRPSGSRGPRTVLG